MKKLTSKRIDETLNRLYGKHCNGIAVPMMSLGAIFAAGKTALTSGQTDDEVGEAMRVKALSVAVTL
mgnify:FL=1